MKLSTIKIVESYTKSKITFVKLIDEYPLQVEIFEGSKQFDSILGENIWKPFENHLKPTFCNPKKFESENRISANFDPNNNFQLYMRIGAHL